jgi:hypothetical protein
MPLRLQIRKLTLRVGLKVLFLGFLACDTKTDNTLNSSTINKVDSIKFKQVASDYGQGKQAFKRLCNTCHFAPERHVTDQYTFDEIFERLPAPSEDYFVRFISDSKSLKTSGDEYAKRLSEVWNSDFEHQFKDSMTNKDFRALITYIKIAAKQKYNKGGG